MQELGVKAVVLQVVVVPHFVHASRVLAATGLLVVFGGDVLALPTEASAWRRLGPLCTSPTHTQF